MILNNIAFEYDSGFIPRDYVCSKCGVFGVKLWRQYQTFLDHIHLMCGPCACADQGKADTLDAAGKIEETDIGGRCDQIGWMIPAVPTEKNDTFWGYTSVPDAGVKWWKKLPTKKRC